MFKVSNVKILVIGNIVVDIAADYLYLINSYNEQVMFFKLYVFVTSLVFLIFYGNLFIQFIKGDLNPNSHTGTFIFFLLQSFLLLLVMFATS
jgi:hypothetical protein